MGGRKKRGPRERGPDDEYEALRERLMTALRRHPGDTRALTRLAASLSRMASSEGRMSARKREQLEVSLGAVLERFSDLVRPPDE